MKAIRLIISSSLMILFLFAGCENGSSDWVKYKDDIEGNIYLYKKVKIGNNSTNQMVQVWGKQVYSDKGKEKELQSRTKDELSIKGYDNLSSKKCLYEIDCRKNRIRMLSIIHYGKGEKVLYSGGNAEEKKWFDIKPDSTSGTLSKEVCPK